MPSRGSAGATVYMAYNTTSNTYQTADAGNHTLRFVKDALEATPTNAPTEVDSTNAPGAYSISWTSAEGTCNVLWIGGKSSTANVIIVPIAVGFENLPVLPTSLLAASSGVNVTQIGGVATSTSAALLGVNVVTWEGDAPNRLQAGLVQASIVSGAASGVLISIASGASQDIASRVWNEPLALHTLSSSAGAITQTQSYQTGAVWINTNGSNGGSTYLIDGTYQNPVNSLANATAVWAANPQLPKRFQVVSGSVITLTSGGWPGYVFNGDNYTLSLGGQNVDGTILTHAVVIGSGISAGGAPLVLDTLPVIGAQLPPAVVLNCGLQNTIVLNNTQGTGGAWTFARCYSEQTGGGSAIINLGSNATSTSNSVKFRAYGGGIQFQNIVANDIVTVDGAGGITLGSGCTGGSISIRGPFTLSITTDNLGTVISQTARYDTIQESAAIWAVNRTSYATPGTFGAGIASTSGGNVTSINGIVLNNPISGRVDTIVNQMGANTIQASTFNAGALTTSVFASQFLTAALVDTTYLNAVADGIGNRSNAVETGLTPYQAWRLDAAAAGGVTSGAGTTGFHILGAGVSTARVSAVTDQSGNRLAVTLTL